MLQVYTGTGKGKTTAALGVALRASGYGMKTLMLSFLKDDPEYGEARAAKNLPWFTLRRWDATPLLISIIPILLI